MDVEDKFPHWIRTGNVPSRAEFGEGFQDDWSFFPSLGTSLLRYRSRDAITRDYGFALPCREALAALKMLSPIVEVGAGTGAWSALLSKQGADVVATDISFQTSYRHRTGRWHPVTRMSAANAIRKWPERSVLMIWPCYHDEWAANALREIKPGQYLALISEGDGGCVGTDNMFNQLGARFRRVMEVRIPCWYGIHDRLTIYRRIIAAPAPAASVEDEALSCCSDD